MSGKKANEDSNLTRFCWLHIPMCGICLENEKQKSGGVKCFWVSVTFSVTVTHFIEVSDSHRANVSGLYNYFTSHIRNVWLYLWTVKCAQVEKIHVKSLVIKQRTCCQLCALKLYLLVWVAFLSTWLTPCSKTTLVPAATPPSPIKSFLFNNIFISIFPFKSF